MTGQAFHILVGYLKVEGFIMVMGNFNCVCHVEDRERAPPIFDTKAKVLAETIEGHEITDVG